MALPVLHIPSDHTAWARLCSCINRTRELLLTSCCFQGICHPKAAMSSNNLMLLCQITASSLMLLCQITASSLMLSCQITASSLMLLCRITAPVWCFCAGELPLCLTVLSLAAAEPKSSLHSLPLPPTQKPQPFLLNIPTLISPFYPTYWQNAASCSRHCTCHVSLIHFHAPACKTSQTSQTLALLMKVSLGFSHLMQGLRHFLLQSWLPLLGDLSKRTRLLC